MEIVHRIAYGSQRATQSVWYRILHDGEVLDYLSIGHVQQILADSGVDMATLIEITD